MIGFKLNEEEKDQLVLSRIGKNERIREKALKKFENFERIKEIKNFTESEAERRKVELSSIKFSEDNIKVIILSKSKHRESDIELYVFAHLYFLRIEEKLPNGIVIDNISVVAKYI
jgi:hypothetical protein